METLPREVKRGILKIEKLDLREKPYWDIVNALSKIQPVGQPFRPYLNALDRINDICKEKAMIWNTIRNFIIPPTSKTLWQIAISKRLAVTFCGQEKYLTFDANKIKEIIKIVTGKEEK